MGRKKHGFKQEPSSKNSPWWKRLWGWSGFGEKKLWDWLQLLSALAIPVVLAAAGFWFTAQQNQRQQQIEDQRAESERQLEDERAESAAFQAYLDQISHLLLEKDLRGSGEDSTEARTLARAQTLTLLHKVGPSRKTQVMQFLSEAKLINSVSEKDPIIELNGVADLTGAYLSGFDLESANLSGAGLSNANLDLANLRYANLSSANLSDANLSNASLGGANLSDADMSDTNLSSANLSSANLRRADLSGALLGGADLSDADMSDANLSNTNLNFANLSDANLSSANLKGADLSLVEGISRTELEQQAESLEGATMPDGTIIAGQYATWWFEPALSFSVSDGWRLYQPEYTDAIFLVGPEEGGVLAFTSPLHVFDPSTPSEPKEITAPENADEWVSWFQRHPNVDTSDPVSVRVGSASGKRIDVTYASASDNYPRDVCGERPCVPLYKTTSETMFGSEVPVYKGSTSASTIVSFDGIKDRFYILEVGPKTVVINVSASAEKFDAFSPKAQEVLDSVEWNGG